MVKVAEESKRPGPDWNRRLKRLLLCEIVVALVGLGLFYGYLTSKRVVTLTGLAIATAPQPLPAAAPQPPPTAEPVPLAPRPPAAAAGMPLPNPEKGLSPDSDGSPDGPPAGPPEAILPGGAAGTPGSDGSTPALSGVPDQPSSESSPVAPDKSTLPSPDMAPAPPASAVQTPEACENPALIEIGDYVLPGRLAAAKARLEKLGIPATVEERVLPTPMYRVYLGPFPEGGQALALRAVSRRLGDQPFLEKRPQGYYLIISSFYLESNVEAWLRKYREAGYDPRVMREQLPIKHSLLLVNATGCDLPGNTLLERLRQAGFAGARRRPALTPQVTE
jgi:hypothetical protein